VYREACEESIGGPHHVRPAHGHGRSGSGERAGQRRDSLHRDTGDARHLLGAVVAHHERSIAISCPTARVGEVLETGDALRHEPIVNQLISYQHVGDAERERGVCARPDAHPLLGRRGGAGEARVHLDEAGTSSLVGTTTSEGRERLDRRPPRFEQWGTEREHETGSIEVIARRTRDAVCQSHDRIGSVGVLVAHVVGGAERTEELSPHIHHRAGAVARKQGQRLRPPRLTDGSEALDDQ
jgi:hypothetical protein